MWLPPITSLTVLATDPCADQGWVCDQTYSWWGNATVSEFTDHLIGGGTAILIVLVVGFVIRLVLHRMIDRLVRKAETGVLPDRVGRVSLGHSRPSDTEPPRDLATATRRVQRAQAMGSLLKSIVTGVVLAIVITMVLAEVGIDVGPIIASAGIIGIALGFGAQSLVSDFLAGTFMIFEDQYGVGDVVDLGEASGTVEAVSLRVTRLRDVNGTVWYVRNGEIVRVGNMSQNWARTVLDVVVAYDQDLVKVRQVLKDVAHDLWEDDDFNRLIIEEPEVWGVESMTPDGITVRVTLKTAPMEQWAVAREMRVRIKARFDHEGIHVPAPTRIMVSPQAAAAAEAAATS